MNFRRFPATALLLCSLFLSSGLNAIDSDGISVVQGLVGEYFNQKNLTSYAFSRVDRKISFDWLSGSPLGTYQADNFSVRWKGKIIPKVSGEHVFRIECDGGVRLTVGDTIILNKWNKEVYRASGKIRLSKGKNYPVTLEYQDISGAAMVKLHWSCPPELAEELVPDACLLPKLAEDGMIAMYFQNPDFTGPEYSETVPSLNLSGRKDKPFSLIWTGRIEPVKSGYYGIKLTCGGNAEFRLNNMNVPLAKKDLQSAGKALYEYSGRINLSNDRKHRISVRYSRPDASVMPACSLEWLAPSAASFVPVPPEKLYPEKTIDSMDLPVIFVDASDIKGNFTHFWEKGMGSCHAAIYLREDMKEQLKTLAEELGIGYLRFHGILNDQVGIYAAAYGAYPSYNWNNCDKIYDVLLANNVRPFVEFSYMPTGLASGSNTIFFYKGNITPPADYDRWADLLEACVTHWKERYGLEEIRKWRFEIWNEPNLYNTFWLGSKEDYFKLYEKGARAIKSVDTELKVGGPSTAGMGEWVQDFLEYCKKNSVPVDFVSTHGYPWDKGKFYDRDKDMDYDGAKYFYTGIRETRNKMEAAAIPGCKELHITEWGVFDYDKIQAAPYICHVLKDVEGYADSFAFWAISDIFEEMGPVLDREFPGIFGLMNVHGLKKASYNAFLLLKKMGDKKVEVKLSRPDIPEIEAWASRTGDKGTVQVMVWNYVQPERPSMHREVTLKVKNTGFVNAAVRHYRIDSEHGDVYSHWEREGKPYKFSEQEIVNLKESSGPVLLSENKTAAENGGFEINIKMPVSSISLIEIEPVN